MTSQEQYLKKTISYLTDSSMQQLQDLSNIISNSKVLSEEEKDLSRYELPQNSASKTELKAKIESELLSFAQDFSRRQQLSFVVDDRDFLKVWQMLSVEERKDVVQDLKNLQEVELAEILENRLTIFEDLLTMPNFLIQKLLQNADSMDLCIALKDDDFYTGTSNIQKIREKIFSNLTRQQSICLQEDIEFIGPVFYSNVLQARKKICEEIQKLF